MSLLGEELRRLRGDRSLRAVEKATKISNAYLSQIENGKIDQPSPHILHKLADYYDVPYAFLMEAAGYLKPRHTTNSQQTKVGGLEAALLSEDLSEEEAKEVKHFIQFLRLKRDAGHS